MPESRARKVITHATQQACDDQSKAIFEQWRADTLARTGRPELDCYLDGRPLPVQITTRYVEPPPPTLDVDPLTGEPKRDKDGALVVLVPSDPKALLLDDVALAMQGKVVRIDGARDVVIDVSSAVPWVPVIGEVTPAAPMTLARRTAVVGGSAAASGAAVAGGLAAAGLGSTMVAAGGAVGALVAGAVAFFNTK